MACPTCRGGSSGSCSCVIETPEGAALPGVGATLSPFIVPTAVVTAGPGMTVTATPGGLSNMRTTYTVTAGGGGSPDVQEPTSEPTTVVSKLLLTSGANSVLCDDSGGVLEVVLPGTLTAPTVPPYYIAVVTFSAPKNVRGISLTPVCAVASPAPAEYVIGPHTVAAGLYVHNFGPNGFSVAAASAVAGRTYRFAYLVF